MSNAKANNEKSDESSLGILNMENLKMFGEISGNSSSHTSERLNLERFKAFETLQKSQKSGFFKKPQNTANKENVKSPNNTPKLNHTEYVPFCRPNTINISDLVSDKTIHLENSSSCTPTAAAVNKDVKISFEPGEITGRSTLYHKEHKKTKSKQEQPVGTNPANHFERPREVPRQKEPNQQPSSYYTVEEILASSLAPKVRNLCETLRSDISTLDLLGGRSSSATTSSTSFTNYNVSRSLPRTADLSYATKDSCTQQESFSAGSEFSFMKGVGGCTDDSAFSAEDFAPGELMQSKLLNDEISWAQEYAVIPSAALSEQAKAKASIASSHAFDSPSVSNSILASDPNFSLGNFFNMRSEDIRNIMMSKSPEKSRAPIALVDESRISSNTIKSDVSSSLTPKIDNRTYSKVGTNTVTREQTQLVGDEHESKDSGNATDNSYLLSMSAIDRALCNLDIHTDDSGAGVINEILKQSKKSPRISTKSSNSVPEVSHHRSSLGSSIKGHAMANGEIASIAELILANKENLDPQLMRGSNLSDTISLTESFLDSTDMKQLQRSSTQPRSPLSPLNIPNIQVTEADREADIDEWPTTPIKSPNRRVRRTKSPNDPSPACSEDLKKPSHNSPSTDSKTPVNSKNWKPKSLCSTRLDDGKNVTVECDFGISPNLSKSGGLRSQTLTNGSSPAPFDCSPMSSPMSSHASSPSGSGFRSPRLDSTTNSERRCLTVGGAAARKAVSSPVTSESGTSGKYSACAGYGVAPMRSYSSNSVKSGGAVSGVNGAAGRSVSRCSNSSEFSHRDGKVIPLKVTTLELSWASTKLRTDVRKSMQVKNIANKRLVVRIEIQGPGFQIVNSQSNMLTLQSQECRSIIINFCPTITGTAIGMLSFYSPLGSTTANTAFLEIPLFGYGGHCSIQPQNILKGPVGSGFLPMGDLCELSHALERTFKIHNKGPLLGFAIVCIDSLGLHLPRLCDTFEVSPQCMLIPPGKAATVRVVFRPKRDDIKKIIKKISNVLTLANMRVMCGDEPNRQRMRRLVQRMTPEERSKIVSNTLDKLWTVFPDEVEMTELAEFRERSADVMDLLTYIRLYEIALTLNHDNLDESAVTSSLFFPDADETVLFRTVCHAASPTPQNMLDPVDELLEEDEAMGAVSSTREGSWSVSPSLIEFDFDSQRRTERVSLLIRNSFKSRQYFEVVCNHKDLLSFTPSEGYVEPDDGQIEVEVHSQLDSSSQSYEKLNNEQIMIMIYMENERITVPVKIIEG